MADNRVPIAAFAAILLANLLIELLGGALSDSPVGRALQGPLVVVAYVLAPLALLIWLAGQGVRLWRRLKHGRDDGDKPVSPTRDLAGQAVHWGDRLARDASAEAASWFRAEEPQLRRLLDGWARAEGPVPDQTIEDLATIADSLETWYVRRRQLDGLTGVNEAVRQIASRAGRPELEQLAAIRSATVHRLRGDLEGARAELERAQEIGERAARHPHAAALEARHHHERAMIHLAEAERHTGDHTGDHRAAADELENAARFLEAGWARLPRADVSGEITTLINLATVALNQERLRPRSGHGYPGAVHPDGEQDVGRLSRIADHLGLAEAIARAERDLAGLAHTTELRGVAAWLDERHRLAAECWRDAADKYAELGLADGQARCIQHLGSAIVVVPEVSGLLRDNQWVALDDAESLARAWLERSKALRAKIPYADTDVVDYYLAVLQDHGRLTALRGRADPLRFRVRELVARTLRRWKALP